MTRRLKRRSLLQAPLAALAVPYTGPALHGAAPDPTTPAALLRDPQAILDLPEGFSYRVIGQSGARMSDGYRTPGRPDAMGCFEGPGDTLLLMRNHEMLRGLDGGSPYFPGQSPPPEAYDPAGTGGVTRIVVDRKTLAVRSTNLVLAGTFWNCAGGYSPWGWLSCEETLDPGHGYVFVCSPEADRVRPAERIAAYGRFRHEAATVDPRTLIAYLTQDDGDACFYRFVPADRARPFEGKLQALRVKGRPAFDTSTQRPGERLAIDWVDIDRPDPGDDDGVQLQGRERGAARFARNEGIWREGDQLFFTATAGGVLGRGQIFRLTLGEPSLLEVIAESTDPDTLDMPDNLCVSPRGVLYIAEDGLGGNFLRRLLPDGRVLPFARNAASTGEFAGPCFSPDGRALFVNLQAEGLTLAISGPFDQDLEAAPAAPTAMPEPGGPLWPSAARGLGTGLAVIGLAALAVRRRRERGER